MPETPTAAEDRSDLTFGQIALREKLVTVHQLKECLEIQTRLRTAGIEPKRLGEILTEKGYLNSEQVARIQQLQSGTPPPAPAVDAPPPARPASATNLLRIPGYEFVSKIGQGAMGTVFKARQVSMDRLVAVKVLAPKYGKDPSYVERFLREARAVARLNHENVISGIDVGESNGFHYFVMEFVDGEAVSKILRREKRIDEKRCVDIGLQIARALEHAERNGLVHRDVKPENMMITKAGVAKLCDLGLAKQTKQEGADLTQEGLSVGTPNYIAPEQARGEEVDIRADIYSLGASLYHMATGTVPFDGPNPMVIMTKHVTDPVEPPIKRFAGLSEGMNQLILRMMSKRREDRHQSVAQVVADLELLSKGGVPVFRPPTTRIGPRREGKHETRHDVAPLRLHVTPRRSSSGLYLVAAAAVLVLGIGAVFLFRPGSGTPEAAPGGERREPAGTKEAGAGGLEEKHKLDLESYRSYCRTILEQMKKGWIYNIVSRGESYTREYVKTPYESEWIRVVAEMRLEINKLIHDRHWKPIREEVEKCRSEGNYAEAIRRIRTFDPEYAETEAGEEQRKLLRDLEAALNRSYVEEKTQADAAAREGRYDDAYRIVTDMVPRYGAERAAELQEYRAKLLDEELAKILVDPPTPEKTSRALQRLKSLRAAYEKDAEFQRHLTKRTEEVRKRGEDAAKNAAARAPAAYRSEVVPEFEKALAGRDLLAARRALREFWSGDKYALMRPAVFAGEVLHLSALLDPQRATPADAQTVAALEAAAREAQAANRTVAYEFLLDARGYALLEALVDQAGQGAVVMVREPGKFAKCSEPLRTVTEAAVAARGAADPWRLQVTRLIESGSQKLDVHLAPRTNPFVGDADLVTLSRKALVDGYAPLRAALLFLYSGQLGDAAGWLEQVKDPAARFGIERYLERVRNIASPAKEREARTKFQAALKAVKDRKTPQALQLLRDLRDHYANTDYLTTLRGDDGREMPENRLKTVLGMIELLEKGEKDPKDKKKAAVEELFAGTARLTGGKLELTYVFGAEDLTADFTQVATRGQFEAVKQDKGVHVRGSGIWYCKAQFKGDVLIEVALTSHADQGIGLLVHGKGGNEGYWGAAEIRAGGGGRNPMQNSILFKLPWSMQNFLQSGSKVDLKREVDYVFRLTRAGAAITLSVENRDVVTARDTTFTGGQVGVALADSDVTVRRIRILGDVDKAWLDEELRKLEK